MKSLMGWGGERVLQNAQALLDKGLVQQAEWEAPWIKGTVLWNNRPLQTSALITKGGILESHCPCYTNRERGLVCDHVIALGLVLVKRATDPQRDVKYREEMRRASRLATISESSYIRRVPDTEPGAVPARLHLTAPAGWLAAWQQGGSGLELRCELEAQGRRMPLDQVPRGIPYAFSRSDESLLFVLEDISEGPPTGRMNVGAEDFLNILRLLSGGGALHIDGAADLAVNPVPVGSHLRMNLDGATGELRLLIHTEVPFMAAGEAPAYLVSGRSGWVLGAGQLWPLEAVLPRPYHGLYQAPVAVPRSDVIRFMKQELPLIGQHMPVESDLSLDLFSVEPAIPRMRLVLRGSPASVSATLLACYDAIEMVAAKPDARGLFALPAPDDLMGYRVRNPEREQQALTLLERFGLRGPRGDELGPVVGSREVLNLLGTCVPFLRRHGWQVTLEGRVGPFMDGLSFATPVVNIQDTTSGGWFDVGFNFEDGQGASLSAADVQRALRMGDAFIQRGDRALLIDSDAVTSMLDVFADCGGRSGSQPGHFLLSNLYAPFVKSSLDGLDGVDVEVSPDWRDRAARQNRQLRIEPSPLNPELAGRLRLYQREGVDWLYFLERGGFCGILADEMGLGKTIQTLAWLSQARADEDSQGLPALIICPTSLVDNWESEAAAFVPWMRTLKMSGADRHELWSRVTESDLVITSYALLRRDCDRYAELDFAVMVLDEAQHIKNRSTQNALSAKRIPARHRVVLTGTPMENSVSDLWSIMDFLMPGYLGSPDTFRANYELPIGHGDADGELAQTKLRRKLQPFLLRRLKVDVAADLPPKIEKTALCALSADQKVVYAELLAASRRRVSDLVAKKGFNQCRMEILTTLLRLRQASCHLELLNMPQLKAENPSAKMDMFFELIDEALDGGHRVLVFSQFVSMLTILRRELDAKGLGYCYLDGSTQNRGEVVREFNTNRSVPLFLISLKAGGTGLNLTGADMVIHFDPWWNPAVEDQATDRAHRIGQKRTVYSVKLIAEGTIEQKVLELQKKKRALIDATIESDEDVARSLSWEDVQELLEA
jgi:superfamily II DNA or RNA helicase